MDREAIAEIVAEALRQGKINWFLELRPYDDVGKLTIPIWWELRSVDLGVTHGRKPKIPSAEPTQVYFVGVTTIPVREIHPIMMRRAEIARRTDRGSHRALALEGFVKELSGMSPDEAIGSASLVYGDMTSIGSAYVHLEAKRLLCTIQPDKPGRTENVDPRK